MAKNEVATTEQAALPAEISDFDKQFMEDAGQGTENITTQDLMTPFISILQALSPQLNKQKTEYIPGAEQGQFLNTVSQATFDGEKGLYFVPCTFARRYTEWQLREKGGGLVNDHGTDASCMKRTTPDSKGRNMTPEGTQIVESGTFYILLVDKETGMFERAVLSLSSTQMKKSRRLNTMLLSHQIPRPDGKGTFNPPMFYHVVHMTSVPESNEQGSWYGFKFVLDTSVRQITNGAAIYAAAKDFREAVNAGLVKTAEVHEEGVAGGEKEPSSAF